MFLHGELKTGNPPALAAQPESPRSGLAETAISVAIGQKQLILSTDAPVARQAGLGAILLGAIFNASELAAELSCPGATEPDLVLEAYRKWGADFPRHLHGEFAFVLWDAPAQRILLGRDLSGLWPLFYTRQNGGFAFSNSERTLLQRPGAQVRVNDHHIAHWIAQIPAGDHGTFFEGNFAVPRAQILLYESGRISTHDFWRPRQIPTLRLRDSREYADGLLSVLNAAIAGRLTLGCDAASQLSGGLDSSSVTALAARALAPEGRRVVAFTAVPAHPVDIPKFMADEGPSAAAVAAKYTNIEHVRVPYGSRTLFSMLDLFSPVEMRPPHNPTNYEWLYEISLQTAGRGFSTILTGLTGNTTFSYDGKLMLSTLLLEGRIAAAWGQARTLHRNPQYTWKNLAWLAFNPFAPASLRHWYDHMRGFPSGTDEYSLIRMDFARRHGIGPSAIDQSANTASSREYRLWHLFRADPGPAIGAMRSLTGVHMTDPSLDLRVAEYCLSVPVEHFWKNGVRRSLIRNAMNGVLPDQVRLCTRRGVQASDFATHFRADRPEAAKELALMRDHPLTRRALDLDALADMLTWTEEETSTLGQRQNFWPKLTRAFALGRFLRRLDDGSLLRENPLPPSGNQPGNPGLHSLIQ
jgi:asparagine synthase (glutamine-hydrolysing)